MCRGRVGSDRFNSNSNRGKKNTQTHLHTMSIYRRKDKSGKIWKEKERNNHWFRFIFCTATRSVVIFPERIISIFIYMKIKSCKRWYSWQKRKMYCTFDPCALCVRTPNAVHTHSIDGLMQSNTGATCELRRQKIWYIKNNVHNLLKFTIQFVHLFGFSPSYPGSIRCRRYIVAHATVFPRLRWMLSP